MTTIAYRDGVLAADSAVRDGQSGIFMGRARKLFTAPDGAIAAFAGNAQDAETFRRWFEESDRLEKPELKDNCCGYVVEGGVCYHMNDAGVLFRIDWPFHADGTGGNIAIGAMAHGASAEEAVSIACGYDAFTGPPVVVLKVGV